MWFDLFHLPLSKIYGRNLDLQSFSRETSVSKNSLDAKDIARAPIPDVDF